MPDPTSDREFQRARSEAQKAERRQEILSAARSHLADVGLDAFSLGPLAKAAGVARGTLYLYFRTREEVLLALYLEETGAWLADLEQVTTADMPVDAFLTAVFRTASLRPAFLQLAPQVTGVIESNVSLERLTESKRLAAVLLDVAGRRTALALGRPPADGPALASALFALLIGITQTHRMPRVDLALLPADVRQLLLAGEEPLDAFVRIGGWLVDGSALPG